MVRRSTRNEHGRTRTHLAHGISNDQLQVSAQHRRDLFMRVLVAGQRRAQLEAYAHHRDPGAVHQAGEDPGRQFALRHCGVIHQHAESPSKEGVDAS